MHFNDELHRSSKNSKIVLERIQHLPIGGRMKDIPKKLWHDSYIRLGDKKTGGPNLRLLRLDPQLPSNTITGYVFNKFVHPYQDRFITPREAARLQDFPDLHIFCGPTTSVQKQIGNAVPVGLSRALASHLFQYFRKNSKKKILKSLSLFSGAGGLDIGFEEFFKILSAIENDKFSCQTLRANFPEISIIESDITKLDARDAAKTKVDLIFGGPPCQPFSAAGKQAGTRDPRGKMLDEYMRFVDAIRPKVFLLENVKGLVQNKKGGALRYILKSAEKIGYETEWQILKANSFGVPQKRERLIVLGRLAGLPKIGFPTPTHFDSSMTQNELLLKPCKTVGEAILDLPPIA